VKIAPRSIIFVACCASILGSLGSATAFHHDLSATTAITLVGSQDLPRIPPQGRKVMVLARDAAGGGTEVVKLLPFTTFSATTQVSPHGSEAAVSDNGRVVAWEATGDPLHLGLPGSQIVLESNGAVVPGFPDPSGTSHKPSVDKKGRFLVFESAGDLTNTGIAGVPRVYVHDRALNGIQLAGTGSGTSHDAMVSAKGGSLAFVSTSDPVTGADTGIPQIWTGRVNGLPAHRVTSGAGASTEPLVSDEGRLVAFSSTADLAGDGHDTGTKQIFVYDDRTQTYAQITDDPGGCSRPAVSRVRSDWRVAFVCSGQAYFYMLREDQRYHLLTVGGDAQGIFPEMGVHFVMVSTNANMYDASLPPNPGYRIILRNLFALPAPQVPGTAVWFPSRGIPSF